MFNPTVLFGCFIILLAHQAPVFHEIKLIPSGKLAVADNAGKAMEMIDEILGFSDHLGGWDSLLACCAFCTKTPAKKREKNANA